MPSITLFAAQIRRFVRRQTLTVLAVAAAVSPAAAGVGDFFDESFDPNFQGGWRVSVDSLFMGRTDDMTSVLMRDTITNVTASQNGHFDLGTQYGPMINIIKDGNNGWGVGVRYFSLLNGDDGYARFSDPFDSYTESFNGLQYGDLVEFDTAYSSELHNVELNLRKQVRQNLTVFVGYRFLELGENFDIRARNGLPQEPAIEISSTDLTNRLHGAQIGAQATVFQWQRLSLDAGGSTGIYHNHVHQTMFVRGNGSDLPSRTIDDNQVSFVNDLNLTGAFRIRDHLTFRAGLQMMWLTDVALAPEQTQTNNFATDRFSVDNSSDVFYFGGFTGLQFDF